MGAGIVAHVTGTGQLQVDTTLYNELFCLPDNAQIISHYASKNAPIKCGFASSTQVGGAW